MSDVPSFVNYRTNNGSNPIIGSSILLGTATFTTTGNTGSTTVNFTPATITSGIVAQRNVDIFTIDGVAYTSNGVTSSPTNASPVASGLAVNISVPSVVAPEPTSLAAVAGLGAIGFVRRRRTV